MENNIFTASLPTADQSHAVFNAVSSHMFSGSFMHPGITDHNTHEQIMASNPLPSSIQEELVNNLYVPNNFGMPNDGTPISGTMCHIRSSFAEGYSVNTDMGTPLSATSLTNLLSSDVGSRESLFSINNSSTSALPLSMRSLDSYNAFNSSCPISRNNNYSIQDGAVHDEFLKVISSVHPSYYVLGSMLPGWNLNNSTCKFDHSDNYSLPRNDLSLSLGSCQPSVICVGDIPDHCSEKSCSIVTQVTPKDSEELSLFCAPSSSVHFSHVLWESRYLHVAQQVLSEVANYAVRNSEEMDDLVSGIEGEVRMSFSSSCSRAKRSADVGSEEFTSSGEIKSQEDIEHLVPEENKAEKTKLVTMLQMVDHRYNQCSDHIQNIITTFHDATNSSSPQKLARFALHTVTSAFKKLRERITSQILLASQEGSGGCMRGKERAFKSPFVEKQWALQLGRKDQQSWRPQRGLPERSLSFASMDVSELSAPVSEGQ